MPLQQEPDSLLNITRFQTSSVMEMVMWIQALTYSWQSNDYKKEMTDILGQPFVNELADYFRQFHMGCDFVEIAIEYPEKNNIRGFLDYISSLKENEFIFYILGRIFPKEEINTNFNLNDLEGLLDKYPQYRNYCSCSVGSEPVWMGSFPAIRDKLVSLLGIFWEKAFKQQVERCEAVWAQGIEEKEKYLRRYGATKLYKLITGKDELPEQLPEGVPHRELVYIPITRMARHERTYFGWGNVSILFDATRTEKKILEIEEAKKSALLMIKALNDEKRLKIIKYIADEAFSINGKMLAEKLSLSPSVISRHLAQLRDAGIIEEQSPDNRNITYKVNKNRLNDLSSFLLLYIND